MFRLNSSFSPTGDQPQAIDALTAGVMAGLKNQVLLGVTGSGKTFTMANIINKLQMPALVMCHNKTLAGQLYQEFRDFFPESGVSYFVSYYDFYQPEAYIPSSDTYIEKESQINDMIDKLRLQSTSNILTRKDVVVVASVSCIYNIGNPTEYGRFICPISVGDRADWRTISVRLIELQYDRAEFDFKRGTFRLRGNYMDIYPAYEDFGFRVYEENGLVVKIIKFEPLTGKEEEVVAQAGMPNPTVVIYPAKHNLTSRESFTKSEKQIRADLEREVANLKAQDKLVEAQRLNQKVNYDLEIMKEVGYVNGIENYSRYFDGRKPGDRPNSLIDFFRHAYGENFVVFVDESHMTIPQVGGMFNGDFARKRTLIDFGFRMQAAYDNRPLKFDEFYSLVPHFVHVSATPNEWEVDMAKQELNGKKQDKTQAKNIANLPEKYTGIVEQLVRPTGIVDPLIEIRPSKDEIPNLIEEIEKRAKLGQKILVTALTKKNAEDLTEYLKERGVRAEYLHSDIKTLERSDILENLRKNNYDVLIGVNLLREGLDLPEVYLVAILDADKEGFLRSRTSLIQTMGRAARNIEGEVIMYADKVTRSMKLAMDEIDRRREYQLAYNKTHNITPVTIHKPVREKIVEYEEVAELDKIDHSFTGSSFQSKSLKDIHKESLTPYDTTRLIKKLEREMKKQADLMNFETAIAVRDKIRELQAT